MGLTHYNREKRTYSFDAIREQVKNLHYDHFEQFYDVNTGELSNPDWLLYRPLWETIHNEVYYQETGKILGTTRIIDSINLVEHLATHPEAHLRLAAFLVERPIFEDLLFDQGLRDFVEDFYLKTYKVAPRFSLETDFRENQAMIAVRVPCLMDRLATGHPSPRRVIRDFRRAVRGFWSIKFTCLQEQHVIFFSAILPTEVDHTKLNPEFIKAGVKLINSIRSG